jgi:hypothetical protein
MKKRTRKTMVEVDRVRGEVRVFDVYGRLLYALYISPME